MIHIKEAMQKIEHLNPKTRYHISRLCADGKIPAKLSVTGMWMINDKYLEKCIEERKKYHNIDDIMDNIIKGMPLSDDALKQCRRKIHEAAIKYKAYDKYLQIFSGLLISDEDLSKVEPFIRESVRNYHIKDTMYPIAEAADKAGLSVYILKKMINEGKLRSEKVKNDHYIPEDEIERLLDRTKGFVSIYSLAKEIAGKMTTSFDIERDTDRNVLNNVMKNSRLKSVIVSRDDLDAHSDRRNALYVPERFKEDAEDIIKGFLGSYGVAEKRLETYINDKFWDMYPKTFKILELFSENKTAVGMAALMETLIFSLKKEITDCNNEEIQKILDYTDGKTQIYLTYVVQFIRYVQENYPCRYDIILNFDKTNKKNVVINTLPYSIEEYMAGAYMAFHDDYIKKHNLIDKALASQKHAVMWLHMIWQYVGAWRTGDFFRMTLTSLPWNDEEALQKIKNYDHEAMITVSLLLESSINSLYTRMHKTGKRQDDNFLTVVFQETLRPVIGLVYAICYLGSDRKRLGTFNFIVSDYVDFFGPEYIKIFGNATFSNRRANKAFLDNIAEIAEKEAGTQNKVLGYAVCQFARGHASSEWKLSETTSKYLSTKLDGMTQDEILMELWETGACSFVTSMLLETVYGEKYSLLPVKYQTQAIKKTGFLAFHTEMAVTVVNRAFSHAEYAMTSLFRQYADAYTQKKVCTQIITSIISRQAGCKQKGVVCILAALKKPCACIEKQDGFGCPYAIYERSYFFFAVSRLREEADRYKNARTDFEKKKILMMIEEIYLPAIYEILVVSKTTYAMDIDPYKQEVISIMEELKYA